MTGVGPLNRAGPRVRADLTTPEITVAAGDTASVQVEITNVDDVIRSYSVAVLGLDPSWTVVEPPHVDLFPGERASVDVSFALPESFPAGERTIAIEVGEPGDPDASPVTVRLALSVPARDGLVLTAEPATLEIGSTGTFIVHVTNLGNTTHEVELVAQEPERLVNVEFDPPRPTLLPDERAIVQATVTGKRPWFGMPAVRALELHATAGSATAFTSTAVIQKPRFSRRLVSLLGLLAAVTVFAFVIALSFRGVADLNEQNAALVRQSLGHGDHASGRIAPSAVAGRVASPIGGIDGVAVELYGEANPVVPVHTTVTDQDGRFRFASVAAGTYLLRFEAAGFGQVWWPSAETAADATPIDVDGGRDVVGLDVVLAGRPGSLAGTVLGADVAGALVVVQLPATAIEGSEIEPVATLVASVELDATGRFVLPDLGTPATYELVVSKPGFATEVQTVSLRPGEQREGVEVLLRRGDGILAGLVVDTAGLPLGGVVVEATDGVSTLRTRSLSGEASAGTFELRDLPTPGTYTLSLSAPGYFDEIMTITLDAEQRRDDLTVVLTSDRGSLSGTVRATDGRPLGAITVTVVGADLLRTTETLSVGEVGSWHVRGLPVPGAYTVSFRGDGLATQALAVELAPGPDAVRTGVDVVMTRATASVRGTVTDARGTPIGGVEVALERSGVERRTISSDQPPGAYGFDGLAPGAYTLTYRRAGSTPQTLLVDLSAGEDLRLPDVQLEQQARVTGVVRRGGVGEAGVGVVVYRAGAYPGAVVASSVTGPGGAFTIEGLEAPESYIIEFQVPAGGPVAGSRSVFLRPGETVVVDFDL